MSQPSQGQRSAADGHDDAHANGSLTTNGAARSANGVARRPAERQPLDVFDVLTDLAVACIPAFCDGLQFELTADGLTGLSMSFPPAPDGVAAVDGPAPSNGVAGQVPAADGHRDDGGNHAKQRTSPGRIVIAVHAELLAGEPPVVGTITCTWHDHARPTDTDAMVAGLLADQAAAKLRLKSLDVALQKQLTRAANLEEALATNREIGQAIGILMATDHVTADQAFEQLRTVSQHTHRKLRDIAADVAETGVLIASPEIARAQVKDGQNPDGRADRRSESSSRVQRRTRAGHPVAADEA
jgi:hypothetical protein